MYTKRVPMTLTEAVAYETDKGFDSRDEFREVMGEIADLYDVSVDVVYEVFYNQELME
jgi:hypothetical protein